MRPAKEKQSGRFPIRKSKPPRVQFATSQFTTDETLSSLRQGGKTHASIMPDGSHDNLCSRVGSDLCIIRISPAERTKQEATTSNTNLQPLSTWDSPE